VKEFELKSLLKPSNPKKEKKDRPFRSTIDHFPSRALIAIGETEFKFNPIGWVHL